MSKSAPPAPIRLLLIEDSPGDARLIQEALKASETVFHVGWAQRLAEGLERLAHEAFDVIVLDLSLPDSQGISTVLTVNTKGVAAFRVLLLDSLVDFSKNVQVQVNGAEKFNGPVTRSVQYALDRIEKSGDPGRIVWGEIPLTP